LRQAGFDGAFPRAPSPPRRSASLSCGTA
jgi:hypothetical protein